MKEEKHNSVPNQKKEEKENKTNLEAAKKLEELNTLLAAKEKELTEAKDKHLRLYAEFDNYRKRVIAEKDELCKIAANNLLKELLPILDSFERAQQSFDKHSEDKEELKKGLALIHRQLEDVMTKFGIKKLEAKGQKFDPQLHEAIMQQDAPGVESHTIIEEVQNGYLLNGKLLRPAMVIIAK